MLVTEKSVSDQDLLQIAKTRAGPDGLRDWTLVRQINSSIVVDDGKFIRARPGQAFVFRKENAEWRFFAVFNIQAVSDRLGLKRCTLRPKPPSATVRSVIRKDFLVLWNENFHPVSSLLQQQTLKEDEIYGPIELFLRIEGIDHNIRRIRWTRSGASIDSGSRDESAGDSVTLKRINNIWVIVGIGRCFS